MWQAVPPPAPPSAPADARPRSASRLRTCGAAHRPWPRAVRRRPRDAVAVSREQPYCCWFPLSCSASPPHLILLILSPLSPFHAHPPPPQCSTHLKSRGGRDWDAWRRAGRVLWVAARSVGRRKAVEETASARGTPRIPAHAPHLALDPIQARSDDAAYRQVRVAATRMVSHNQLKITATLTRNHR